MHGIARLINRGPCPLRRASIQFLQKHYDIQNRSLFMGKVRLSRSFMNQFKNVYNLPPAPIEITPTISQTQFNAETVHAVGYLVKVDSLSKELVFARMVGTSGRGETLQLITRNPQICQQLRDAVINSPISIAGKFRLKKSNVVAEQAQSTKPSSHRREDVSIKSLEIDLLELTCLNSFPHHIRVAKDQVFLPEHRHMQIRYDFGLRERLAFRSDVAKAVREYLHDFQEVETPILFKSTPEGAKEFLVPSRKYGHAYALPQSPQQYKQILMASGIEKYLQFARCFRDEDLRADRQPEFTQIDIELAFAGGNKVMRLAEGLIKYIYHKFSDRVPAINIEKKGSCQQENFPVMTYDHAMSYHGTDKPDTRITGLITQINEATSIDLCTMLTTIADPIIECCKLRLNASPNEIKRFINNFMKSPDAEPFISNPDGAPGFAYYDTSKPLSGLQIFGFEGAATLKKIYEQKTRVHYEDDQIYAMEKEFAEGDLFLIQARPNLS
ncbi:aspartyl-tRNA synthetase, partial [Blumeria hordei DH14]